MRDGQGIRRQARSSPRNQFVNWDMGWKCCSAMRYNHDAPVELWWDAEDAEHIRSRSTCYPHAADIEPEWTLQAAADPARVVRDPDPQEQGGLHPAHRLLVRSRLRPHRDH